MSGWIKLHRSVLDNDIYRFDPTAWRVFVHLLLLADKKDGTGSFGRKQLSAQMGNNENTIYKALKRLSVTQMVTLSSNNKFTRFSICKWEEYQGNGNSSGNNQVTTGEQPSNNQVTHYKNKEVRKKNIDAQTADAVFRVYRLYIERLKKNPNTYKLTDTRKQQIKRRLKDAGEEMLTRAITNLSQSKWHVDNNQTHLELVTRSYEQVEKFANKEQKSEETLVQKLLREEKERHELKTNQ